MRRSTPKQPPRSGFSLLEMLLAMAILLGAIAVLGELARLGRRSGGQAATLTEAQLLCESLLAEFVVGQAPAEPVEGQALPQSPGWVYSIERHALETPGLAAVRVTVAQDLPPEQGPVSFSLTRWLNIEAGGANGPSAPAVGPAADREAPP